jgi:hypothetical protein
MNAMTNRYSSLIGLPWYRPERYDQARSRMADGSLMPESYHVWLKRAEEREHETNRPGCATQRVYVDGDEFVTYCAGKNLVLDGKARTRYAADFCAQVFKANMADYNHATFWPGPIPRRKRR